MRRLIPAAVLLVLGAVGALGYAAGNDDDPATLTSVNTDEVAIEPRRPSSNVAVEIEQGASPDAVPGGEDSATEVVAEEPPPPSGPIEGHTEVLVESGPRGGEKVPDAVFPVGITNDPVLRMNNPGGVATWNEPYSTWSLTAPADAADFDELYARYREQFLAAGWTVLVESELRSGPELVGNHFQVTNGTNDGILAGWRPVPRNRFMTFEIGIARAGEGLFARTRR